MITFFFAKLGARWALRALAEKELRDLDGWRAKLAVSDYRFNEDQAETIEKLFPSEVESLYAKEVKRAWYKAARAALPVAIAEKRKYLAALSPPESSTTKPTEENAHATNFDPADSLHAVTPGNRTDAKQ